MDIPSKCRERLEHIELACKNLEDGSDRLSALTRRLTRTKSAKALEALQTELTAYQTQVDQLRALIEEQTWAFFADAFGLYPDGVVRVLDPVHRDDGPFVVNQVSARLLSDGKAVLFLAGDSLSQCVGTLPKPMMFTIHENSDTRLEVEA